MTSFLQKLGFGLKKSSAKLTGGISSIFTKRRVDAQTLDELEELLISSDIGVRASAKIIGSFAKRRLNKDAGDTEIKNELAADIKAILQPCEQPLAIDDTQKPFVILMVGVNGAGKTTTIGKLSNYYRLMGYKVMMCAADTFRAGATEQLQIWGKKAQVDVIAHGDGADPAAVVYDGVKAAIARKADVLFVDTAGRLHNKTNLMKELDKIYRVIRKEIPDGPHETLLVLDATTGQNAISQAKIFLETAHVTGVVLTKLDGTAKGGVVVAIKEELGLDVKWIGIGEGMMDFRPFDPQQFVEALFETKK